MFDKTSVRLALPLLAGVCGAALYMVSPLSHQAFCAPLSIPVLPVPAEPPSGAL